MSAIIEYTIFVAVPLLLIIYIWKTWKFYLASFKIKGPVPLPILGNCLEFLGSSKDIFQNIARLIEKTSGTPIRVWIGPYFIVITADPGDFKILLNHSDSTTKSKFYKFVADAVTGDGILTQKDVTKWRHHRKLLESTFSNNILNSFIPNFEKNALILCRDLEKMVEKGTFDIFPRINICSIDTLLETAMGTKVNNVKQNNDEYAEITQECFELCYKRYLNIWNYPDVIYKHTEAGKRFYKLLEDVRNYCKLLVEEKKQTYNKNNQQQAKQKVFLDYLIEISQETGEFTEMEIRNEVGTFMFAGSHSTALTVSFSLMLLGMHPEIQDKVYDELREIFNDNGGKITKEDLDNMNYLHRVIKETMRLFPFVPFIGRTATGDIQLRTCFIPKGTDCILSIFHTHRDPKLWPNPLKFDPDRFLSEEIDKRHPYSWIPFSAGPKNCIGLKYGYMAVKIMLAHLLIKYEVSCKYKNVEDIRLHMNPLLVATDGHLVTLKLR